MIQMLRWWMRECGPRSLSSCLKPVSPKPSAERNLTEAAQMYVEPAARDVALQLSRAGVRLALVLNRLHCCPVITRPAVGKIKNINASLANRPGGARGVIAALWREYLSLDPEREP
jgi:hypothetical protein